MKMIRITAVIFYVALLSPFGFTKGYAGTHDVVALNYSMLFQQGTYHLFNPNLESEMVDKSGFNTIRFTGAKTNDAVLKDNGLSDSAEDKDFTVQVQAKFNNGAAWLGSLSKGTLSVHVTTGWVMIYNGGNGELLMGGKTQ